LRRARPLSNSKNESPDLDPPKDCKRNGTQVLALDGIHTLQHADAQWFGYRKWWRQRPPRQKASHWEYGITVAVAHFAHTGSNRR
jgi:hypothetical protein